MNRLAIMQPYFLPYIGYFALMAASDRFVLFDDVNFINRGWINRNRILMDGHDHLFTVPLQGASQHLPINAIAVCDDTPWRKKLLRTIEQAYRPAPFFAQTFALLNEIIHTPETNLSRYVGASLTLLHDFLGLRCTIIPSSTVYANADLKAQDRILDICRQEQATQYLNLPGGQALYQPAAFAGQGVQLDFVASPTGTYVQFGAPFVPHLSIIDVLMFNGRAATAAMLEHHDC
ncbi:hypothetical protein RCH09_002540 [Actimicrobium sp. GrIS 1.19]|uniref:WbqC family protein n=1 Tax=Actimicrobium sp. GrIS 1.19 TaxID=3071708 RepID=UPI002E048308|nr:hypothetical protein [Actimicrobium sp. GrIS 1.19]